jgi:uncharacterized protein
MNDLLIAGGIGAAFGCSLECAGLGDPPKLARQFYLRDFTVLKVMLSAMLTAMLGAFWGSRLGMFDSATFYVPDTYLLPQLLGGLVFGFGFVLSGLCPGTSCVALASGRIEGAATMLGVFAGVLLVGLAFPAIEPFYRSTSYGPLTLQRLTGLPFGVMVALVTVAAVSVLAWIAKLEDRR